MANKPLINAFEALGIGLGIFILIDILMLGSYATGENGKDRENKYALGTDFIEHQNFLLNLFHFVLNHTIYKPNYRYLFQGLLY